MISRDPKHCIQLPLHDISAGTLLTECVRAYLYVGNPSALIGRILEGVQSNLNEKLTDPEMDVRDHAILTVLTTRLVSLRDELRQTEEDLYPPLESIKTT